MFGHPMVLKLMANKNRWIAVWNLSELSDFIKGVSPLSQLLPLTKANRSDFE